MEVLGIDPFLFVVMKNGFVHSPLLHQRSVLEMANFGILLKIAILS